MIQRKIFWTFVFSFGVLLMISCAHRPSAGPARPERQTLLIALDGVPYSMMEELKEKGGFTHFQDPARVITTFPSISHTGFGGLFRPLGASQPPGYDREYYSYQEEKIVSFLSSVNPENPNDFKNFFDYARKTPFQKFWIYAAPGFSGRRDLEKIRKLVWSQPNRDHYFAYIGGTDGTGHILGEKRMKRWLEFMDQFLSKLRADYRKMLHRDLEIVLFSDHGFHFWKSPKAISRSQIETKLHEKGLQFAGNLKKEGNVVAVQWGNISGASFYVHDEHVPTVAKILAETPGIDLVAYRAKDRIDILAQREKQIEEAQIYCDTKRQRCRYQPIVGDPLGYKEIVSNLRQHKKLDREGNTSEKDWFEASKNHRYPDALYRLHDGFFTLVENPAQILFSTYENYEYGDVLTRIGAWFHGGLKGTHGGLFDKATAAFVMTTDSKINFQPVMRYDQVMPIVFDCGPNSERNSSCLK